MRFRIIKHGDYVTWQRKKELAQRIDNLQKLEAAINIFNLPFYFNPLRTSYAELTGNSALKKMLDYDCYGLSLIKEADPVIFDIGAHIGLLPRVIKQKFPNSRIFSLEPDRENYELLAKNNAIITDASSYQLGVYEMDTYTMIRESDQNSWRSTLAINEGFFKSKMVGKDTFSRATYEVKVVSIDNFISTLSLEKISLIGITVPGEIEMAVLKGAVNSLIEFKPILAIYLYPSQKEIAITYLKSIGYFITKYGYKNHCIFMYANK